MPNPQIGLAPLTLISPNIPAGALTLSVDSSVLPLVINADGNTIAIDILIGTETVTLTNPVLTNGVNQFTGTAPLTVMSTTQIFQLTGRNFDPTNPTGPNASDPLLTPTLQYDLIYLQTQLAVSIAPPSGITIYKGQNTCKVEWSTPQMSGFQGVRVQWSTDPSGINTPYQQYGGLVTNVSRSTSVPLASPTSTTASTPVTGSSGQPNESTVVTTTTSMVAQMNFSNASIPQTTVNATLFYVTLTTVIQDPVTNAVYESLAAGPFLCGFVNLQKVHPTDFLALQKSTDIASRLISSVTTRQPQLDLTAHAELRDVLINTFALEVANMSVRAWFERCCTSISALAQIDDANGDGISDPVASSPMKQQIASAYGLSATDVQTFISGRFDILGEQAGLLRGGSTVSTVSLTFFVYTKPASSITISNNVVCSTTPNSTTAAVQFITTGSAVIDPSNAASYYDPVNARWSITVPGQCLQSGSIGEVGAGTIRQVVSGGPSGVSVTNTLGAEGGQDQQSNADYAAMIQNRLITGVDTGSRNGLADATLQVPGVTDCLVVAANDNDMLRDWSAAIQRHTYGCVDIYTRGTSVSQQAENLPFVYQSSSTYGIYSSYLTATLVDATNLRFKIGNFPSLPYKIYTAVEFVAISVGRTVWLGVQHAQFDNTNGFIILDPTENAYTVNADGSTSILQISNANATNLQVIQSVGTQAAVSYSFMARYDSGIDHTPALQPLLDISSIIGPTTGGLAPNTIELYRTNDFLLTGGSNDAGDTVVVQPGQSVATSLPLTLQTVPVRIDSNMDVPLNAAGQPTNILSVLSSDLSTLYTSGVDYSIIPFGPYHQYAITVLAGGALSAGTQVVVGYNKFVLNEILNYETDTLTLDSTTATALLNNGFVDNTWLPASHGNTTLLLDGYSATGASTGLVGAGVAPSMRYIKVSFNNGATTVVGLEGQDFVLTVDSTTGSTSIARITGGAIPDGQVVTVNYFTTEVFVVTTDYPTYVQQTIDALAPTQHADCDLLVKAMVESPVDITLLINLESNVSPATVDGTIRTLIGLTLNNANTNLAQSVLSGQVQSVPGVASIPFPLVKCAKSDGSYDIGYVITTGTVWNPLASDTAFATQTLPANAFITAAPVLQNPTIPSGGLPNAYVGLLYEGQPFARCLSIAQFLTSTVPSFYIIGTNDSISSALPLNSTYAGRLLITVPPTLANPGLQAYRCTYQVFGASGATDISVASTEYLSAGSINLLYASSN